MQIFREEILSLYRHTNLAVEFPQSKVSSYTYKSTIKFLGKTEQVVNSTPSTHIPAKSVAVLPMKFDAFGLLLFWDYSEEHWTQL